MRFKEPHCVLHMLLAACVFALTARTLAERTFKRSADGGVDYGTALPLLQPEDRIACCDRITTAGHGRSIMTRISCGISTSPARQFEVSLLTIRVRDGKRQTPISSSSKCQNTRHTHRAIIAPIESSRISQLVAMMTNRKWNWMRQCRCVGFNQ
ncbi:uncharacterized protein LOC6544867 [Drosophila erecta]|uniref:uncharacterized protein LOC6544867 n=1 Tax=Drosophila erecta TaxID=7220 RepID=UPI0001780274|nr:uncharacterized protein LOC6544867 [Drosophila erecta]